MAEKYSQLELAPTQQTDSIPQTIDQAANAPERDLSGDAPELDNKSLTPQVGRDP